MGALAGDAMSNLWPQQLSVRVDSRSLGRHLKEAGAKAGCRRLGRCLQF